MFLHHIFFGSHLEEGEVILAAAHRHWAFFLAPMIKFLFFGLLIPVLIFFMFPVLFLLAVTIFGISLILFVLDFYDWYFDAWLITNLSIIDLDWVNLFVRRSSRIDYETIEGVSYETTGFWGYMLRYGDIQIDKASGTNAVMLHGATRPKRVELEILRHRTEYIDAKTKDDEHHLRDVLTSMIRRQIRSDSEE